MRNGLYFVSRPARPLTIDVMLGDDLPVERYAQENRAGPRMEYRLRRYSGPSVHVRRQCADCLGCVLSTRRTGECDYPL